MYYGVFFFSLKRCIIYFTTSDRKKPNQIIKNPNKLANKMKLNRREKEKAKMKKKKFLF